MVLEAKVLSIPKREPCGHALIKQHRNVNHAMEDNTMNDEREKDVSAVDDVSWSS